MPTQTYEHQGHEILVDDTAGHERVVVDGINVPIGRADEEGGWGTRFLAHHQFSSLDELARTVAERALKPKPHR